MLCGGSAQAQSVSPTRAILTENAPAATLRIANPAEQSAAITLHWAELKAESSGRYRPVSEDEPHYGASDCLSVSPAGFTLAPGAVRKVELRLARSNCLLPMAERRSHLMIEARTAPGLLRRTGSRLPMDMITAIAVPVILREDSAKGQARIGAVSLTRMKDGGLAIETELVLAGSYSVTPTLAVKAALAPGSEPFEIARAGNLAVYPDAGLRRVRLPLGLARLPGGQMELILSGESDILERRIFIVGAPPKEGHSGAPSNPRIAQ